jgi:hypothetical protein
VIAVENNQRAPRRPSFIDQSLEEFDDLPLVITSIQLIAGLDDNEIPSDPAVRCVNGPREGKCSFGGSKVTMKISNGDNAGSIGQTKFAGLLPIRRCVGSASA